MNFLIKEIFVMLNEEYDVAESVEVETEAQEEPAEEETVEEETVEEEALVGILKENVEKLEEHNDAVAYLRQKDCKMLTILKAHLGENIRLHKILDGIKAEIARLKALLNTPKPKLKILLIIFGVVIAVGGMLLFSGDDKKSFFYASLAVGAVLVILAIVLKVLGNKKWEEYILSIKEKIVEEEVKAAEAQKNIDDYWRTYAEPFIASIIPDKFPKAYVLKYDTVCGMLDLMENLRADTVKEAINLYEEICFRSGMRSSFRHMETSLNDAARSAERSANAAERSASANELAAASAASMAVSAARAARASEKASRASVEASRAVRDRANRY